ncbi:unnamed protein product [Polarella glacialis]|uniref:Uncharacterized protein n=1 Tax=Polarella glacialis TaxID=89957 RepID=A0A813IMD7_POLGL|nr:unnamed protein product [Polarella glacialis]CAE8706439.1 unnamed protein product [Polarella glacialis]
MQATYRQARPGAMRHFSGFWQVVPTGKSESLVMFYTEAIPGFILPAIFRSFDRRALEDMARSLLQDLRCGPLLFENRAPHLTGEGFIFLSFSLFPESSPVRLALSVCSFCYFPPV